MTGLFIQAVTKRSATGFLCTSRRRAGCWPARTSITGIGYAYPPFMAMIVTPFVFLPPLAIRVTFFAMCALCAVMMVRAAWRIAAGPPIDDPQPWRRQEWAVLACSASCAAAPIS